MEFPSVSGEAVIGVIDIGGTKIAVGLLTPQGKLLVRRLLNTSDYAGGTVGANAIIGALTSCLIEHPSTMCGIGVGCTGPVDPLTGTVGRVANLPGWEGFGLTGALVDAFGVPAVMENDADAAALAEHRWGSGRGAGRFLYVTLSTGIGVGFIVAGQLYRGNDGAHPEIGHHTIDCSGPLCYCGASGCWESLASGLALRDWYLQSAVGTSFPSSFGARDIFALFDNGDVMAKKAVARLGRYVGIGLANLTTMFVPDVIALGGGLTERADVFLSVAEPYVRNTCGEVPAHNTRLNLAHLREDIGLVGAGAAWLLSHSPADAMPV